MYMQAFAEDSQKDQGLNVRKAGEIRRFIGEAATTETHQSATHARISRKLKVKHERS
jgi:hypothetical protein